jgi:hypothetical protein
MPYSITLRSRTDARITGWYDGSDSRWSTDHKRQKPFDQKGDARPVCEELRNRCPRNARVISIESERDDLSVNLTMPTTELSAARGTDSLNAAFSSGGSVSRAIPDPCGSLPTAPGTQPATPAGSRSS